MSAQGFFGRNSKRKDKFDREKNSRGKIVGGGKKTKMDFIKEVKMEETLPIPRKKGNVINQKNPGKKKFFQENA